MPTIADLRNEHREIAALARGVCPEEPATPAQAARARSQLATLAACLGTHLAAEDPAFAALGDAPATRLATATRRREAADLTESFGSFSRRWGQPGAIERDPRGFASTWELLHGALGRLLAREESDIYPLAADAWETQPVAAPPATGIAALDDDHAQIFALIGGLRAATGGGGLRASAEIIAQLVGFADRHFLAEEQLMEASDYPGIEDHRQEHHRARGIILGFRNDHLDGRNVDPQVVLGFLESWLVSHIAHTDQMLVGHLRSTGHAPA